MSASVSASRIKKLKWVSFANRFQKPWLLPVLMSIIGLLSISGFAISTVTRSHLSLVNFRPLYGKGSTNCSDYVPYVLNVFGIKDCRWLIPVLCIVLIFKPIGVHILLKMMQHRHRVHEIDIIDLLLTFLVMSHIETLSGHQHLFASYVCMVVPIRLIYFNTLWNSIVFVLVYMSDMNSVVFGGDQSEWFWASNLYIVSCVFAGILALHILRRNSDRKWEYTQSLLVCMEHIKCLEAYPKELADAHRGLEVTQCMLSIVRDCREQEQGQAYAGGLTTLLLPTKESAANSVVMMGDIRNSTPKGSSKSGGDAVLTPLLTLPAATSVARADNSSPSRRPESSMERIINNSVLGPPCSEQDDLGKDAKALFSPPKNSSYEQEGSRQAPASTGAGSGSELPSKDKDASKQRAKTSMTDSFLHLMRDSFVEDAVQMGVMLPYTSISEVHLPIILGAGAAAGTAGAGAAGGGILGKPVGELPKSNSSGSGSGSGSRFADSDDVKVEGISLDFSHLKCCQSVVISVCIVSASASTQKDNIYNLLDSLSAAFKITNCRNYGDIWIGSLGIFGSHGTIEMDCYRSVQFCCAIQHVVKACRFGVGCSVGVGEVVCGFMGDQVLDVFGKTVRWSLETTAQVANSYLECGIYLTDDVQKSLVIAETVNFSQIFSISEPRAYHRASSSSQQQQPQQFDSANASHTWNSERKSPSYGRAESEVPDFQNTLFAGSLENSQISSSKDEDSIASCDEVSESERVAKPPGIALPHVLTERQTKCVDAPCFTVLNGGSVSDLDPKVLQTYRDMIECGQNHNDGATLFYDQDSVLPDIEFRENIINDLSSKDTSTAATASASFRISAPETAGSSGSLLACDIPYEFIQSSSEKLGFDTEDPILLSRFTDEELIEKHCKMTEDIETLEMRKCFNNSTLRRMFGLNRYSSDFCTKIVAETIEFDNHGKTAILTGADAQPEVSATSHSHSTSAAGILVIDENSPAHKYVPVILADEPKAPGPPVEFYDAKYQAGGPLRVLYFVLGSSIVWQEVILKLVSKIAVVLRNLWAFFSPTKKLLTSSATATTDSHYVAASPEADSSYHAYVRSAAEESSVAAPTLETVMKAVKINNDPAEARRQSVHNMSSRVLVQNRYLNTLIFMSFQAFPLFVIFSRPYNLKEELKKKESQFGNPELFTNCFFGHIFAQLLLEQRFNDFAVFVCIMCRLVMIFKFPVKIFDYGFRLQSPYSSMSMSIQTGWVAEIGIVLMCSAFAYPVIFSQFSMLQVLLETMLIVLVFILRINFKTFVESTDVTFPGRASVVAMLIWNVFVVSFISKLVHSTYILEKKIWPYAQAVHRKYANQVKSLDSVYFPENLRLLLPRPLARKYTLCKNCAIVAVHIGCADILPAFVTPSAFGSFFHVVTSVLNKTLSDCGLIRISSCSGIVLAICTEEVFREQLRKTGDLNSSSTNNKNASMHLCLARVLFFVDSFHKHMQNLMSKNDCSIVWSAGLHFGEVSIGMPNRRRTHFDAVGPNRDFAIVLTKLQQQQGGVFASDTFDSMARLHNAYLLHMSLTSRDVIIDGKQHRVHKIGDQFNGITLDDLDYVRLIGKGGYGSVHLVREKVTSLLYAVKVIQHNNVRAKDFIQSEFVFLQDMLHPNVVDFRYCITGKTKVYLVMNYVRGGNLMHVVETMQPPLIYLITLFAELVLALEYIHGKGVIHCDIKPMNCLVGTDGHLKVADFGLSKFSGVDNTFSGSSNAHSLISKLLPLKRSAVSFSYTLLVIATDKTFATVELQALHYKTYSVSTPEEFFNFLHHFGTPDVIMLEMLKSHADEMKSALSLSNSSASALGAKERASPTESIPFAGAPSNITGGDGIFAAAAGTTAGNNAEASTTGVGKKWSLSQFLEEVSEKTSNKLNSKNEKGLASVESKSSSCTIAGDVFDGTSSMADVYLAKGSGVPLVVCTPYADRNIKAYLESCSCVRAVLSFPLSAHIETVDMLATVARDGRASTMHASDKDANKLPHAIDSISFSLSGISNSGISNSGVSNNSAGLGSQTTASSKGSSGGRTEGSQIQQNLRSEKHKRLVGTLYYLAPETIKIHRYSPAVDWWSCGVTMYECITRSKLFTGKTKREIIRRILSPERDLSLVSMKNSQQLAECDPSHAHVACLTAMPITLSTLRVPKSSSPQLPLVDGARPVDTISTAASLAAAPATATSAASGKTPARSKIEDLLLAFLTIKRRNRLGTAGGASEVKRHPFFQTINWETVNVADPPFKPPQFLEHVSTRKNDEGGGGGGNHIFESGSSNHKLVGSELYYDIDHSHVEVQRQSAAPVVRALAAKKSAANYKSASPLDGKTPARLDEVEEEESEGSSSAQIRGEARW